MPERRSKSAEKYVERLRGSTSGWSHDELAKALKAQGFTKIRETRHGTLFENPGYPRWATVIIPRHRDCKRWVAQSVLEVIERLLAADEEGKTNDKGP